MLVSLLALGMVAGLTTAGALVHRREAALAPRPSASPSWVALHAVGGPRLGGNVGPFEIASPVESVRIWTDPLSELGPIDLALRLRAESWGVHDCYHAALRDADAPFAAQVTVSAMLWPSGGLSGAVLTAEPEIPDPLRRCLSAAVEDLAGRSSTRTETLAIVLHFDFTPGASRAP